MSLTEALVALVVGFALLALSATVTLRMAGVVAELRVDAEVVEIHRLVGGVLDTELAGARPGLDWAEDPDGLAVRAFRGWGVVCRPVEDGAIVGWMGLRLPDPAKDSLELVLADGRSVVVGLESTAAADPDPCSGSGAARVVRWPAELEVRPDPVLVRLFERGLYALTDAFRYRRGRGGRQPLTPAVLDADRSGLRVVDGVPEARLGMPDGSVRVRRWVAR